MFCVTYIDLYLFWSLKVWWQNLDYAKDLQAKYFNSKNIPIYGITLDIFAHERRIILLFHDFVALGPPSLSQLQSARQSHSQTRQDGNTAAALRGDGQSSSSSSHGYQQPEPQSPAAASAPPPKPVGGFGTIMCVCCGASDHKTPNCPQRKNFFF